MTRLSAGHLIYVAFIAAGVVIGGSLAGGLARLVFVQVPLPSPSSLPVGSLPELAGRLKLWGTFAALGGTFTALQNLESGLLGRSFGVAAAQLLLILSAFAGAHLAYLAVRLLAARRVDTLTLLTTDLLRELAETENELARLREHPPEVLAPAVAEVRLELVTAAGERLPPATEVTLRRQLDPVARQLVGENVYQLSPAVVRELFARREVRIEEAVYRLEVESIVLGPRTVIRLRVSPVPGRAPAP